jgi:hypothetical protein
MRSVRLQQKSEFFFLFIGEQHSERFEEAFLHMGRKRRIDEN